MRRRIIVGCLLFLVTLAACDLNNVENPTPPPGSITFRAEANRDAAFVVRDGERETLPLIQQATATTSDGLAVDEGGRATLSLNNVLTLELLRAGQIEIKSAIETDGAMEIVLQQAGGLLFSEFNPERRDNHSLIIQTTLAAMTTTGTRLIVTRSADNIEWFVNLGPADSQMTITVADDTQAIPGGTARWVSPDGLLSDSIPINGPEVEEWFDAAQNGAPPSELAEVLLPPADIVGNVDSLTALPRPGEPFELGTSGQGVVQLTLDPIGLFGAPTYRFEDCTGDGNQELAMLAGVIHFDFGSLAAQVKALDVTLINRDLPGNGAVWTTGLDGQEVTRQLVEVGGANRQTLSLRSTQAYHSAQLALIDGCLIGFSLTPPSTSGAPAPPRVITNAGQTQQSSTVVNILAEDEVDDVAETSEEPSTVAPAGQQRTGGSIDAWPLAAENAITIDGDLNDWDLYTRQNQTDWTRFSRVVYNQACDSRFPGGTGGDDLSGQVLFAYDAQSLYVVYQVVDDGFVGYSGADRQYFLGDAPQLSLDMELLSDYTDTERNRDDWQIDFFPDPASPLAVLWQLGTLSSRQFEESSVAARRTDGGYILEAAIPWISLGVIPQPGDRIGLAANINDNDTPDSDAQECIISTAPQWAWNNPTTWGTLLLQAGGN